MKLKPYYLGLVLLILLGLTASSAFGVGTAGTVTGGTFPACVDPANTSTSTVKIAGKQVAPGGLVRVPPPNAACLPSETTLKLNSYVKTILVSPTGADNIANGTLLQNAMNNATAGMLVKVEPGTYDLVTTPLIMKQGVDLEGSGEGLTTITSQINITNAQPPAGTVVITNSSEVRFLTISNLGNSINYHTAVYASGVDKTAKLSNLTITTSGISDQNYGIFNNFSSPTILNSTVTASGSNTQNYGIYNYGSEPKILNSTITASGASYQNAGILNYTSYPIIQNSTITASDGSFYFSIFNTSSTTKVAGSQLGAPVGSSGGLAFICVASYNSNFVALSPTCT